jgi:ferric-dicitrate binding protein FerR (iron transport regulator)
VVVTTKPLDVAIIFGHSFSIRRLGDVVEVAVIKGDVRMAFYGKANEASQVLEMAAEVAFRSEVGNGKQDAV